jgi:hypothetical protein
MTNSNEAPDVNLLNQLQSIASQGQGADPKVDVSNMSAEEMKQYSENIAIAADEINNENNNDSPVPNADEAVQLKSSTKDKLSIQEEIPVDIESKEELIKAAKGANQAAVEGAEATPATKLEVNAKQLATDTMEHEGNKQFDVDKKSALEEGYSED